MEQVAGGVVEEAVSGATQVPVECWEIPEANGLDRIHVFWMDVAPGKGYVTIICYGSAWTAYFGAMSGMTIREFFAMADAGYLTSAMGTARTLRLAQGLQDYLCRIILAVKAAIAKAAGGAA